jgi:hypothetical protein
MRTELAFESRATQTRGRQLSLFGAAFVALLMISAFAASAAVASGASVVTLNEYSNGHTVTVNPGQHVTLVLHSTYWSIAAPRMSRPLTQVGSAVYLPRLPSTKGGCVAGQGCGTVSLHYVASAPGVAHLHASRTSCGEALRCTAALSNWTVTIRVR